MKYQLPLRIPEPKDPRLERAFFDYIEANMLHDLPPKKAQLGGLLLDLMPSSGFVLEVGCGTGRDAFWYAQKFPSHRVIAVDNYPNAISFAKKHYGTRLPNLEFRIDDIYELARGYKDQAAIILASDTFHHLDNIEDALAQIFESLKTPGTLLFSDLNREDLLKYPGTLVCEDGVELQVGEAMHLLRTHYSDNEILNKLFSGALFPGENIRDSVLNFILLMSLVAAYTPSELYTSLKKVGFKKSLIVSSDEKGRYLGYALK